MKTYTLFLSWSAAVIVLVSGLSGRCKADEAMEAKINNLLNRLTLEEKVQMLSGDETGFAARGVERLGVPSLKMTDGPVGVRWGQSTAFPVSVNLAAA